MIIETIFINISPAAVCQFEARVSLMRHFIPGKFTSCPRMISLHFFTGVE